MAILSNRIIWGQNTLSQVNVPRKKQPCRIDCGQSIIYKTVSDCIERIGESSCASERNSLVAFQVIILYIFSWSRLILYSGSTVPLLIQIIKKTYVKWLGNPGSIYSLIQQTYLWSTRCASSTTVLGSGDRTENENVLISTHKSLCSSDYLKFIDKCVKN